MSSNPLPLVSIIIPVYNGSDYMREAINSALAQTYSNIEILVINDGSTDGGATHDIAASYGDKIRYFKKENGGVVSALNFGIEKMQGEYFSWLSHDDLYQPSKIERQLLALQKHKGSRPAFCVCNCQFINENGDDLYRTDLQEDYEYDKPACYLFLGNSGFNGLMVLIPKILFDRCGLFTPSLATHEYDMWLRIMAVADVVIETKCLVNMRLHSQQLTEQRTSDTANEIDEFLSLGVHGISADDFHDFVQKQYAARGLNYVFDLLKSYMWFQRYPYTSAQTLNQLRRMFQKHGKITDEFYSQLLAPPSISDVKEYILRRQHNKKSLIVIYCESVTDDALRRISPGLAVLSAENEIVLLYHAIDEERLKLLKDMHVTPFAMINPANENLPLVLGAVCNFLNTKVFWFVHTGSGVQDTKIFHFLKLMRICTVFTCYNIEETLASSQNTNTENIDFSDRSLTEALLITSFAAPQTLKLYDIQYLIVIQDDYLVALVRWKMIFGALLGTKTYQELENNIQNQLSSLLEGTSVSLEEYVTDYVQRFIADADQKAAAMVYYYEHRAFWKLTKPLRFGVWFFRKAYKAVNRVIKREESFGSVLSRIHIVLKNWRNSI